MKRLIAQLREHRHIFIVVTLLTLVTTFPTIMYVFRSDVFWHPAGTERDVYIKFWDIWYVKQVLAGQADASHTNLMFYPEGTSLAFHPFFTPHIIVVSLIGSHCTGIQRLQPGLSADDLTLRALRLRIPDLVVQRPVGCAIGRGRIRT